MVAPLQTRARSEERTGSLRRVQFRVVALALTVVLGVIALGETTGAARAPRASKLDRLLQRGVSGDVRVIIRTRTNGTASLRARLKRRVLKEHTVIGALSVMVHGDELAALEQDDSVLSVSMDLPVAGGATAAAAATAAPPATLLASLGLPSSGLTGKGVGVAIIDSGLVPGSDFGAFAFYDFTNPAAVQPYDDYGHGTHVAGLIASKSTAYPGIAPKARLVSLKVLDAHGVALTSTVLDAIQFAIANRDALGIDVINLSLGHPILEAAATDPLVQAVEAAVRSGIVVVVAAGNVGQNIVSGIPGYAGILSPGNAPSAITVGAVDTKNTAARADDTVPSYSSRGPTWYDAVAKPDVVAPGQNLVSDAAPGSTLFLELPDHQVADTSGPPRYFRLSGTSMSTAVTSGVVALMLEANRTSKDRPLKPKAIKRILEYSAVPLHGFDELTQGHGAINAAGAISLTSSVSHLPLRKRWWAKTLPAPVTTSGKETWHWSQTIVWGTSVVWGSDGRKPTWASNVVWSTGVDDDTIVWGTSLDTIVWGTSIDWDTIVWGTSLGRIE
jgi:serine protease AprX